jgi:hypothetical protein
VNDTWVFRLLLEKVEVKTPQEQGADITVTWHPSVTPDVSTSLISHRSATGKDETQSSAPIPNSRLLPAGRGTRWSTSPASRVASRCSPPHLDGRHSSQAIDLHAKSGKQQSWSRR